MDSKIRSSSKLTIILLICSIIFVTCFSYCTSPLYKYYYGGDSAQFLTIGKLWYDGKVPFIDVFDHKGPLIFFIDMLGYYIGGGQKFGIVIIQVIFIFLLY